MPGIHNIPPVTTNDASIPYTNNILIEGAELIQVNVSDTIKIEGNKVQFVKNIESTDTSVNHIGVNKIADARIFENNTPTVIPPTVPVTEIIGSPIVNMPGCVKVHKENVKQRSRNKMLVDDDPKGNTILCDAGAPYYDPVMYDSRELMWRSLNTESDEVPEGVDTGEPPAPEIPDAPSTPDTNVGGVEESLECPPPNARRIGDLNQAGTEKVKEYKLTPDGKICETIWEPISIAEQYLPSVATVSTTATIAVVATSSALLAKPLADLLLKVIKPVVKKAIAKINKILGKETRRPNLSEIKTNNYREKKGLLPINVNKKKKK